MLSVLKTEYEKLCKTKAFWIILILLSAITATVAVTRSLDVVNSVGGISHAIPIDENGYFSEDNSVFAISLFNNWIGALSGDLFFTTVFYFILPLSAALPFSFSLLDENRSGYLRQMALKKGRQQYYLAKYIVTFSSGFLVAVIPILINLIITACCLPISAPDPLEQLYSNQPYGMYLSRVYHSKPLLFVAIFVTLPGIFCGLWATLALCISLFVPNKYIVVIAPYLFLFFETAFFDALFANKTALELSPFYFIRGSSAGDIHIVAGILLFMFITGFTIVLLRGKKDDVY